MKFSQTYKETIEKYKVEEKFNWRSLLAAGLLAAPGAAKEVAPKEQPAVVQKAVKPSPEESFLYRIKHDLKKREGSTNFNSVKKLHRAPHDPTIGWGHSLAQVNQSKAIFKKVIPEFNFDEIFNKKKPAELTEQQAEKLLDYDVKVRLATLKRLYPQFFTYDYATQQTLFDLLYRGDLRFDVTKLLLAGEKDRAIDLLRSRIKSSEPGVKIRVEDSIRKLKQSKFFNKPKEAPKKQLPNS